MHRYSLLVGMLSACVLPDRAVAVARSFAHIDDADVLMLHLSTALQWSGTQTLAFSRTYHSITKEFS